MLWLGCVSLRTVAARLQPGAAPGLDEAARQAALAALEANEWHRLLALGDLAEQRQRSEGQGLAVQVKYFRWRGYLLRYLESTSVEGAEAGGQNVLPPVLAVHGFAASCTQFEPLAQVLARRADGLPQGVRLYALDMLGFGHAEKPPLSFSQYVWEQCVKDFLLSVVGEPAIVMGNSIGGYMAQAAAAYLGPRLCLGVVLLNSAGPLLGTDEYEAILQEAGGTIRERMQRGFGTEAGLPEYSPLPQWLVDFGAWALFAGLQPNIPGILKSLYPSNPAPTEELAVEILRDSKDPFATNVIASTTRLGPSRPSNELLAEYAAGGGGEPGGRLLVCQGMADRLGGGPANQPRRLGLYTSAVPSLGARGVELQGVGHCPHHEAPEEVAAAVQAWLAEEVLQGAATH